MIDPLAGSAPEVRPVHLTSTVVVKGVVLPTSVAIAMGLAALLSALVLIVSLYVLHSSVSLMTREIRALEIYEQDVENILIRANLASRSDFAPHARKEE